MPFIEKFKRGAQHVRESLQLSSRNPTPESRTSPGTRNPAPSQLSVSSLSISITSPPDSTVVSALQPDIPHTLLAEAPPTILSSTAPEIVGTQTSQAVLIGERTAEGTSWAGLKGFLGLLNQTPNVFGPLKSAVSGIMRCVEIYERVGQGREEYERLKQELDSLFEELSQYFSGSTAPGITSSFYNLAKGIEKELRVVEIKGQRNMMGRVAEASRDLDEVLECYRRIQGLLQRLALSANVSVWKIVDEQATEQRLLRLSPSHSVRYGSAESMVVRRGGCTPNTRTDVLKRLGAWAYDSDSEKIYWLNGMAGTGKTTVAYTFCDQLDSASKLAASFFCSRQLPECRNANLIFPTIAYQLARFSLPFRFALSHAIERDPDVCTQQLVNQFNVLILEPLTEVKDGLPEDLIVAIDALDECENPDSVGQMLDLLLTRASDLPVKFFMTSRPEPQIRRRMSSRQGERASFELHLHDLDRSVVKEDIKTYLDDKLSGMKLPSPDLERFAERSGALFIYAATVVRYLSYENFSRAPDRLHLVLGATLNSPEPTKKKKEGTPGSSEDEIDVSGRSEAEVNALYAAILKAAMEDTNLEHKEKVERRRVLHTVVCAQEPLTMDALAGLMGFSGSSFIDRALQPLLSVIHVSEESGLVTTLHESFPRYMLDAHRSGGFHCDIAKHNGWLANRCFTVMTIPDPPFNICNLTSSYVLDEEIEDIEERVKRSIPRELVYACRYWGSHLVAGDVSKRLMDRLSEFLKTRFLLWMEVLNLTRSSLIGSRMMPKVQAWCQRLEYFDDVRELCRDGWSFSIAHFSSHASRSTPHIYVSSLALWPKQRPISKQYRGCMRGLVQPTETADQMGRFMTLAICDDDEGANYVTYSPDGSRILSGSYGGTFKSGMRIQYSPDGARFVSGCNDTTVRIWDSETGRGVGEPFRGHAGVVWAVGYSPDGTRIVSGSADRTLRIWDACMGRSIGEPLQGHTDIVSSVAYSPDGACIVSGSNDRTVRIWDARTGLSIGEPLNGHIDAVSSAIYSPDGSRIASGSWDSTIRIWDAHTGQIIGNPLEGHISSVNSVTFSPDGACIVSGSNDMTVRIWDSKTGQSIGEPLYGHTSVVYAVGYSPDGSRIVSCSYDSTIRIWDVCLSQSIGESLQGHTGIVRSVVFSPDGTRITSGSNDRTVRVWDAHSCRAIGGPLKGHTSVVSSSVYSPDGGRVVSGSWDGTVRIWDARTGQNIGNTLNGHADAVRTVACSPDGTHIVSGSFDRTLRIWDAYTGQAVGEPLSGHTYIVNSVGYSPDGTCIVSGSDDCTVRIWDARTGQSRGQPLQGHTHAVRSVLYSPGGDRIASGSDDGTIRIWDAHKCQMIGEPLRGHTNIVWCIGYSPDGTRIVSGSYDRTVRIWDAHTCQTIGEPLRGHTGAVNSVAYSPDGARIVSGSSDNTIRVWDAYPEPQNAESSVSSSNSWGINDLGWVLDNKSNPLIWVSPNLRGVLLCDPNITIISRKGFLSLEFDQALIGESWSSCYQSIAYSDVT